MMSDSREDSSLTSDNTMIDSRGDSYPDHLWDWDSESHGSEGDYDNFKQDTSNSEGGYDEEEDRDSPVLRQGEVSSPSDTSEAKSLVKRPKAYQTSSTKGSDYLGDESDKSAVKPVESEKVIDPKERKGSVIPLSSDSESPSSIRDFKKEKDDDRDVQEEVIAEKSTKSPFKSSLPLVIAKKVKRTQALVDCKGKSIDLTGVAGSAIGCVMIGVDPSGDRKMLLDLMDTIYTTSIIPSRTFFAVECSKSEAKVEAVMNDFVKLEVCDVGTLEGIFLNSNKAADEVEKVPKPAADKHECGICDVDSDEAADEVEKVLKPAADKHKFGICDVDSDKAADEVEKVLKPAADKHKFGICDVGTREGIFLDSDKAADEVEKVSKPAADTYECGICDVGTLGGIFLDSDKAVPKPTADKHEGGICKKLIKMKTEATKHRPRKRPKPKAVKSELGAGPSKERSRNGK